MLKPVNFVKSSLHNITTFANLDRFTLNLITQHMLPYICFRFTYHIFIITFQKSFITYLYIKN